MLSLAIHCPIIFLDGVTLHSAFDLKFGDAHVGLAPKKLAEFREHLQDLKVIIIDEMSLVKSDVLYQIHRRLMEIFQSEDLFANKTIMLVGDLLQLPPVKGKCIFQTPNDHKFATLCQEADLWKQFEVFELCHNHRQGEGNTWASILNEIREGIVSEETISLLESRWVADDHDEYTTCHVFYTNADVSDHNTKMLNSLDSELFEFAAVQSLPRGYISYIQSHGTIDGTQFMKTLSLKVNARVVLIWNVNTPDGMVNGAMGTVSVLKQGMRLERRRGFQLQGLRCCNFL